MQLQGIHHAALAVSDMDLMLAYYRDALGMRPHPIKRNWLNAGRGFCLHLMPSNGTLAPRDPSRHIAFQVGDLNRCAGFLLAQGLQPYQMSVTMEVCLITDGTGPLDNGIGTLFLDDPEGNTLEFIERGRGIFSKYNDGLE
ncbi:VOC family protein [Sodalis sp. RH19]|uniref:VOC family protein n=1 Tax=Sodalis sp. RH19 TaxID=3394334 RepID=UPI0039B4B3B9